MTATKKTLVEEGTEFKGTLTSSCAIVVMGKVEGQMTGPSVEVTETGVLSGKAKVTELRSRGELSGEFDAQVVELSGRVRDKTVIRAQSLEVSLKKTDGGVEVVFGDCELAVGDAPDKAKAIREATSGAARTNGAAAPTKETPAKETPAKETPAKETPAKETPAPRAAAATAGTDGGGEVAAEADASASAKHRRAKHAEAEQQA